MAAPRFPGNSPGPKSPGATKKGQKSNASRSTSQGDGQGRGHPQQQPTAGAALLLAWGPALGPACLGRPTGGHPSTPSHARCCDTTALHGSAMSTALCSRHVLLPVPPHASLAASAPADAMGPRHPVPGPVPPPIPPITPQAYPPPLVIAMQKSQINTVPMATVAWTRP